MARQAREKSKSGIYHIILRGANKQEIFHDDEDKLLNKELVLGAFLSNGTTAIEKFKEFNEAENNKALDSE